MTTSLQRAEVHHTSLDSDLAATQARAGAANAAAEIERLRDELAQAYELITLLSRELVEARRARIGRGE